jgi:hypothetical protein
MVTTRNTLEEQCREKRAQDRRQKMAKTVKVGWDEMGWDGMRQPVCH